MGYEKDAWTEVDSFSASPAPSGLIAELGRKFAEEQGAARRYETADGCRALQVSGGAWPAWLDSRVSLRSGRRLAGEPLVVISGLAGRSDMPQLIIELVSATAPDARGVVVAAEPGSDPATLAADLEVELVGEVIAELVGELGAEGGGEAYPLFRIAPRAATLVKPMADRRPEHPDSIAKRAEWFRKRHGKPPR